MSVQTSLEKVCRSWLDDNLYHFQLDPSWDSALFFQNLKPYGELVLLAALTKNTRQASFARHQKLLAGWLTRHQPGAADVAGIVREFPQALPWMGLIWQNLERAGVPAPGYKEALKKLVASKSILYFERHAGHDICVHHLIERLGRVSPYNLDELYDRTMLGREAWDRPSDTAIYYICHDIFFLTNWGQVNLTGSVKPGREWTTKLLHWQRTCVAQHNIDLAAELSIALSFLRRKPGRSIHEGRGDTTLNDVGLPAPPAGQGEGFISAGDSEDRIRFFQNYHTVIVCLIALACQPGWIVAWHARR